MRDMPLKPAGQCILYDTSMQHYCQHGILNAVLVSGSCCRFSRLQFVPDYV